MTPRQMEKRAQRLKEMAAAIGRQRLAVVVVDPAYPDQRQITLRLDWEVPFAASVFTSLAAAREWLRQPPDEGPRARRAETAGGERREVFPVSGPVAIRVSRHCTPGPNE